MLLCLGKSWGLEGLDWGLPGTRSAVVLRNEFSKEEILTAINPLY